LGSNSLAAARDAECPVVVVPRPREQDGDEAPAAPGPRVVVGLNVDSPDEATLGFAFTEAALRGARLSVVTAYPWPLQTWMLPGEMPDRKSTRLNSSHVKISYADFCLKKKNK